jgi:hypothetical protein
MDGPTTWAKSWTVKQEWAKQGDQFNRIYKESRCVEGNHSIVGWLAGGSRHSSKGEVPTRTHSMQAAGIMHLV